MSSVPGNERGLRGLAERGDPPEAEQGRALLLQVAWFNRMRLGAVVAVMLTVAGASLGLGMIEEPGPLYILGGLILVVDVFYIRTFPRLKGWSTQGLRRHVDLQIGVDLLILTGLLHFSGGITNPLFLIYMLHAFIAAVLLSVTAGVVVGALGVGLATLLAVGERYDWLPHHPLVGGPMALEEIGGQGLVILLLSFAVTMGFSIYFVANVLRQLQGRERALQQMDRQLGQSEKLASLGTLAAGVSHEINNPVGVIQNKVQVLRYRIRDGEPEQTWLGELDAIDRHAGRIASITQGLLTYSKDTGFKFAPIDPVATAEEALELVEVHAQRKAVGLVRTGMGGVGSVQGSHNHLLQVMVNVLMNAVDASPGGGRVTLDLAQVDGIDGRPQVRVRIHDQGPGIPEEDRERVFDPFFSTKDVGKGTGLGLFVSHGIVQKHGGTIRIAESEELPNGSVGAMFEVLLPVSGSD